MDATVDRPVDQPGVFQHSDVAGDCGERHIEGRRQIGHLRGRLGQSRQQGAPRAIGEGVKDPIEPILRRRARARST